MLLHEIKFYRVFLNLNTRTPKELDDSWTDHLNNTLLFPDDEFHVSQGEIFNADITSDQIKFCKKKFVGICAKPMVKWSYIETFLEYFNNIRTVKEDPLKKETVSEETPDKSFC